MRIETIKREARGIVLALLLVAATTIIVNLLVEYLGIRRGSVIYLLAVLVSGWRRRPAYSAPEFCFIPRTISGPNSSISRCS
jgi:hypothetical protein